MSDANDENDARRAILARRAKFVAAALAGISIACGKEPAPPPQPCLSEPYQPPDAEPMPCLSPIAVPPPDATAPTSQDAGGGRTTDATTATDAGAKPKVDAGRPKPTVCLKIAPPEAPK